MVCCDSLEEKRAYEYNRILKILQNYSSITTDLLIVKRSSDKYRWAIHDIYVYRRRLRQTLQLRLLSESLIQIKNYLQDCLTCFKQCYDFLNTQPKSSTTNRHRLFIMKSSIQYFLENDI